MQPNQVGIRDGHADYKYAFDVNCDGHADDKYAFDINCDGFSYYHAHYSQYFVRDSDVDLHVQNDVDIVSFPNLSSLFSIDFLPCAWYVENHGRRHAWFDTPG